MSPARSVPPAPGSFVTLGPLSIAGMEPERTVRVFLPEGFSRTPPAERRTLLLFDGQNVFDDEGSYAGGWHAHEAARRLRRARGVVAPAIVAVPHGGEARIAELSPFSHGSHVGRADVFLDGVVRGLVPILRAHLGLASGALDTFVGGSSMGGLAALYAHFRYPDTFGGALAMSPSLWVASPAIFAYIEGCPTPFFSRVYLDCGGREAAGRMLPLVRRMASLLEGRGYGPERLLFRADPRATHSEVHWRRRLPRALRFLFTQR